MVAAAAKDAAKDAAAAGKDAAGEAVAAAKPDVHAQLAAAAGVLERAVKAKDTRVLAGRLMRQVALLRRDATRDALTRFLSATLPPGTPVLAEMAAAQQDSASINGASAGPDGLGGGMGPGDGSPGMGGLDMSMPQMPEGMTPEQYHQLLAAYFQHMGAGGGGSS